MYVWILLGRKNIAILHICNGISRVCRSCEEGGEGFVECLLISDSSGERKCMSVLLQASSSSSSSFGMICLLHS